MENTPIINPLYFYLMGVGESLSKSFGILGKIGLIVGGLAYLFMWAAIIEEEPEKDDILFKIKTAASKIFLLSLTLETISCVTPSKETVMSMMVASQVTPKNISIVSNTASQVGTFTKESIIEIIREIKADVDTEVKKESTETKKE